MVILGTFRALFSFSAAAVVSTVRIGLGLGKFTSKEKFLTTECSSADSVCGSADSGCGSQPSESRSALGDAVLDAVLLTCRDSMVCRPHYQ